MDVLADPTIRVLLWSGNIDCIGEAVATVRGEGLKTRHSNYEQTVLRNSEITLKMVRGL